MVEKVNHAKHFAPGNDFRGLVLKVPRATAPRAEAFILWHMQEAYFELVSNLENALHLCNLDPWFGGDDNFSDYEVAKVESKISVVILQFFELLLQVGSGVIELDEASQRDALA